MLPLKKKRANTVIDYRQWCREQPLIQSYARDTLGTSSSHASTLLGHQAVQAVLDDCFAPEGTGATTFLVGRLIAHELWNRSLQP